METDALLIIGVISSWAAVALVAVEVIMKRWRKRKLREAALIQDFL
jgi:hypothetical protein